MQSKKMSMIESNANALVGLVISWLFTYFCLPWFGLNPSGGTAIVITMCYFVLSVARGYILRRIFDRLV